MNFIHDMNQKIRDKRIIIRYVLSALHKSKAYMDLLESVNEIQKFPDPICFRGYPAMKQTCSMFEREDYCRSETCPLKLLNKQYIDAHQKYEIARTGLYQAETAMFCTKIKE